MTSGRSGKTFGLRLLGTAVLCAGLIYAEPVSYLLVKRDVIESRLKSFSRDNMEREAILKKLFAESGCSEHLSEEAVKSVKQPNLVCVLPGQSGKAIIVGAHFDHVTTGDGVVDNWSGASLLPSLYQSLSGTLRKHTFVFVAFTGEELGERGSEAYVKKMSKEEVEHTDAMVNMDTVGLGPSEIWVSHSDPDLVRTLVAAAGALKLPVKGMNVEQVGSTDSEQFRKRKIPSITVHSVTQSTLPILHSSKDNLTAIQLEDYYDTYHLMAGYLAYLDSHLSQPAPQTPPPVPRDP